MSPKEIAKTHTRDLFTVLPCDQAHALKPKLFTYYFRFFDLFKN